MDCTKDFFRWMFGDAWLEVEKSKEERYVTIWSPKLPTAYCENMDEVLDAVKQRIKHHDVYYGMGMQGRRLAKGRGKLKDIKTITCLWADIDLADPVHKKPNLPISIEDANSLFRRLQAPPSILVHSGHGLQAYWLFEPRAINNEQDLRKPQATSRRWQATLLMHAKELGWTMDSVSDLTRVMRVPGTTNQKGTQPVDVKILSPADMSGDPIWYTLDDLIEGMVPDTHKPATDVKKVPGKIALNKDANPPTEKLFALLANDAKTKRTWHRRRTDLPDQSSSGYDLALANAAAASGWSDQEIVNLLIAHRRMHKSDLKLRQDYYAGIILKCRELHQTASILAEMTAEDASAKGKPVPLTAEKRTVIFENISRVIGVPIKRWVQIGKENARYRIVLADGQQVPMGTTDEVFNLNKFRGRIYEETGHVVTIMTAPAWHAVCDCCQGLKK